MNTRASSLALASMPAVAAGPPLNVLVVAESRTNRMRLQAFLEQHGYGVDAVDSAEAALARFDPQRTDLVLMDVLMPGMDGIEATRRLRALGAQRWVPVILISSMSDEAEIVRGLEAGADDYLLKPINLVVLEVKLRSFQRTAQLHREVSEYARMLAQYREQAEAELEMATGLIGAITEQGSLDDQRLTWSVIPSTRFSGDTVAAVRTGSGRLLAMLADATGHGLPAAISLLPALQVFYGMARKDLDVATIATEMNHRVREQVPTGRYLAAVLLCLDPRSGTLEAWNGGMPPGLWVRAQGAVEHEALASRHLPLGVLDSDAFDATTAVVPARDGYVAFYSDGLVEACSPAGEPYGRLRLRNQLVGRGRPAALQATLDSLTAHLKHQPAHDDVSLLLLGLE
jgi:serine phosphatase RsbU (regulator of sigma subunit)